MLVAKHMAFEISMCVVEGTLLKREIAEWPCGVTTPESSETV